MQAHLIGGIPESEVNALSNNFGRFGVQADLLLQPDRANYSAFGESIDAKPAIKATLEADPALQQMVVLLY